MPIGGGSHWEGPLLGNHRTFGGLYENAPIHHPSVAGSKFKTWYEDFQYACVASQAGTNLGLQGWTVTEIGAAADKTAGITTQDQCLLLNCGTTVDGGYNIQHNAAYAAGALGPLHQVAGPITSTTTLMGNRELIWATRIGYFGQTATNVWSAGIGPKALLGWGVTDTSLMTPATGVTSIATGGGIFFHIREEGTLRAVCQRTGTASTVDIITTMPNPTSTTVLGNWIELGFHAYWASDPTNATFNGWTDFYVNGVKRTSITNFQPMTSTEVYSPSFEVESASAGGITFGLGIDYIYTAISRQGTTRLT
jgi:hypothetical protein